MRKTATSAAPVEAEGTDLPGPPHGGSFIREPDGSLTMVEGAIVPAAAAPAAAAPPATETQEG